MGDLGHLLNENFKNLMGAPESQQTAKLRAMQQAWIAYRDTTCNFFHGQDSGLDGDSDGSGLCGARNSAPGAAPSVLRSNLGVPTAAALFNRAAGHIPAPR
jgi:hypothetical protein